MANIKVVERLQKMHDANVKLFGEYLGRLEEPIKKLEENKEKDEMAALNLKIAMRKELEAIHQSIESYDKILDPEEEEVIEKKKRFTPENVGKK